MSKRTASPLGVHGLASIFKVLLTVNSSRGSNCRILLGLIAVHCFGLQFTAIVDRELPWETVICAWVTLFARFLPLFVQLSTPGLVSPVGS
ncbi:unnamed protein product [Linum trigynum]|uniref:Uncharacterized protein n=1 Tax=Linum trigynum TaxID=586398 RepID=A0AAV2CU30_9ROSI